MKQGLFETNFSRIGLVTSAAIFIIASGIIHLVITPLHWEHAPVHGLFLAIVGIAEVAWGFVFWRQPSATLYRIGMVMAGGLITLWVITRLLPSPFGHGHEDVEIFGILCRLCESAGIVALAALMVSGEANKETRLLAWKNIGLLLTASIILGVLTYGTAVAADSVSTPETDHNKDNHHEPAITPAQLNDRHLGKTSVVKEAVMKNNYQEIDLTINASGYSPNVIIAQRGTPLKINVHSEENAGCASKVVFPAINIEKTIPAGSTGLIEILPAHEGTFEFMCPMAMVRGELIIK